MTTDECYAMADVLAQRYPLKNLKHLYVGNAGREAEIQFVFYANTDLTPPHYTDWNAAFMVLAPLMKAVGGTYELPIDSYNIPFMLKVFCSEYDLLVHLGMDHVYASRPYSLVEQIRATSINHLGHAVRDDFLRVKK